MEDPFAPFATTAVADPFAAHATVDDPFAPFATDGSREDTNDPMLVKDAPSEEDGFWNDVTGLVANARVAGKGLMQAADVVKSTGLLTGVGKAKKVIAEAEAEAEALELSPMRYLEDESGQTAEERARATVKSFGRGADSAANRIVKRGSEMGELQKKLSPEMQAWNKAEGWDAAKVFASNPAEVITNLVVTGAISSVPSLIGGVAGAAVAGPVGGAAGVGAGSMAAEFGNKIVDELRSNGVDLTKPEEIQAAFADDELMDAIRTKAVKRGVPVAIFDAASAGVAGKILGPALGKGARAIVKGVGKETGVQMLAGAASEAGGSIAAGDDTSVKAMFEEAAGSLGGGVTETASNLAFQEQAKPASVEPVTVEDRVKESLEGRTVEPEIESAEVIPPGEPGAAIPKMGGTPGPTPEVQQLPEIGEAVESAVVGQTVNFTRQLTPSSTPQASSATVTRVTRAADTRGGSQMIEVHFSDGTSAVRNGGKQSDGSFISIEDGIASAILQKGELSGGTAAEPAGTTDSAYVGGPGAMSPVESAEMQESGSTTGLKRAVVDTERLLRGAEPIPTVERQNEDAVVRQAEDRVDGDSTIAPNLVARIVDEGDMAIDEHDAATLLVERNRVMNERKMIEEAQARGEAPADSKEQLEKIETQIDRLDQAQRAAGTTWGRLGHMYQRLIREDFTLDTMERKTRAALGRPLEADERALVAEKFGQMEAKRTAIEDAQTAADEDAAKVDLTRTYEATIADLEKQLSERPAYGKQVFEIARGVVDRWKAEADASSIEIRKLMGHASMAMGGVNPKYVLHAAKVLRAYIGEFGLNKAEATTRMVQEYGPKIMDVIDKAWDKAQSLINSEKTPRKVKEAIAGGVNKTSSKKVERTKATALAAAKAESLAGEKLSHKTVYEYVRALLAEGLRGEDAVMKAAHDGLKEHFPDATERDIRRAYSDYGKMSFPSKEEIATEMRELTQLTKMQEDIDRMVKDNQDPLRKGYQRDKVTQLIRDKIKARNELLRKRKGPPSPQKLASSQEATTTRLENAIKDVDRELRTGEAAVKASKTEDTPQNERLRAELGAMRAKLKEIQDAKKPVTSEAEKQLKGLTGVRKKLDELLSGRRQPNRPKDWNPLTSAAEDIKAEIVAMQELAAQMRRDAKPKTDPGATEEAAKIKALEKAIESYLTKVPKAAKGPKLGPDSRRVTALKEVRDSRAKMYAALYGTEIYNDARMAQVEKRIGELKSRIAAKDFTPRPKPASKPKNDAVIAAEVELAKEQEEFNKGLYEARQAQRGNAKKIWDGIKQTGDAYTNILSSFDLSAPRQAAAALLSNIGRMATNPVKGAKMVYNPFAQMFRSVLSEARAKAIEIKIQKRPNAVSGADKAAGIEYSALDGTKFSKFEDNAHSVLDDWAALPLRTGSTLKTGTTLLPKLGARAVRISNRAFITFLNATRADLFDQLLNAEFEDRPPTQTELKEIGNYVNIATGRGSLNPMTSKVLGMGIWSPNLLMSRIKMLMGEPLWRGNARTRKIIAKEYARILVSGFLLYSISRLFDEKEEDDITSSDAGKIVRGNTRIDLWGGFQQVTVFAARNILGRTTTLSGEQKDIGAERRYGVNGPLVLALNFARSKARPTLGIAIDIVDRKNYRGEKTTVESVAKSLLPIPLPFKDIVPIMKEHGFVEGTILQVLSEFGAGVSNYEQSDEGTRASR